MKISNFIRIKEKKDLKIQENKAFYMNKLKSTDMKLLTYLYQHNREPFTKIAKAVGLSREQVEYWIKRYESEGIIKKYLPVVSYTRLGYHSLVLFFIKNTTSSASVELKKEVKQSKNRITTVELLGKYDLCFVFVFHNDKEKNEYLMKFLEEHKGVIEDHTLVEPYHMKLYPLKFLGSKREDEYLWIDYQKGEVKIDDKERNILKVLAKNARARIIDIAHATNLSAELVIYKIKRLQSEGILLGTRTAFDMEKLQYYYTILQINIKNLSQKTSERLAEFAKSNTHIETFYLSMNKPNCYMQLFHSSIKELQETIEKLKSAFKEDSFTMDIIHLKNEGEDISPLPFL